MTDSSMNPSSASDPPRRRRPRGGPRLDRRGFLKWTGLVGAAAGSTQAVAALPFERRTGGASKALSAQEEASRFLAQCTFGGDLTTINQVVSNGFGPWLDAQSALPYSPVLDQVEALVATLGEEDSFPFFDWIWWQRTMTGTDLVRQRVAFAFTQIFVISRREDVLFDTPAAVGAFYDILARGAFGNFREMLLEVALHAAMGQYLSHLNNRRSDPTMNRFPDENFAREVMQLFTIGLYELNPDGTHKLDTDGHSIPTYGNAEITEMAKIFTGLTLAPEPGEPVIFGEDRPTYHLPMVMFESEHEPGPKTLLNGYLVPAGQTGMQDIESAVDHLFQHPNVGPFIGAHLIRFLVTSNPSPAYVARVTAAFDDNGSGVRGDMTAVLKAVLLDTEARDTTHIDDPHFGKVREPFVRWVQLGRTFHATSDSGQLYHFGGDFPGETPEGAEALFLAQYPFFSPSVFNFFSPRHQPAGALTEAGLVAPEMEIIHAFTVIAGINLIDRAVIGEEYLFDRGEEVIWLELEPEVEAAEAGPEALIDRLDLLLTYGTLSAGTRQILVDAILPLAGEPYEQTIMALYLLMICPEYAVQR